MDCNAFEKLLSAFIATFPVAGIPAIFICPHGAPRSADVTGTFMPGLANGSETGVSVLDGMLVKR